MLSRHSPKFWGYIGKSEKWWWNCDEIDAILKSNRISLRKWNILNRDVLSNRPQVTTRLIENRIRAKWLEQSAFIAHYFDILRVTLLLWFGFKLTKFIVRGLFNTLVALLNYQLILNNWLFYFYLHRKLIILLSMRKTLAHLTTPQSKFIRGIISHMVTLQNRLPSIWDGLTCTRICSIESDWHSWRNPIRRFLLYKSFWQHIKTHVRISSI